MTTNVRLPLVIGFTTEAEAQSLQEVLALIIKNIKMDKVEHADTDYPLNYIFYTRKDKNYRTLMDQIAAPTTVAEPDPTVMEV